MAKQHNYDVYIKWTGNNGNGTASYKAYERSYSVIVNNKPQILASSDPAFRGDPAKHNPEELLVAAVSACHMLWYLHLCSDAGVVVVDYVDQAKGTMSEDGNGSGKFTEVVLNPVVTVTDDSMIDKANALHARAHEMCYIARSVNFTISHNPQCVT